MKFISFNILLKLDLPRIMFCFWDSTISAILMKMPKTTMNKYNSFIFW